MIFDETYGELMNAIVLNAVEEWRELCERVPYVKDLRSVKFDWLKKFFKSEWCAALCGRDTALTILEGLEKERLRAVATRKSLK